MTERSIEFLAGLTLDDGSKWGEAATPWQLADARAVLAPEDGAARLHWLSRPKGGSKSTDAAAMSLAWLDTQAPALAEGFAVASDEEQANRLLDRARGLIARGSASLRARLDVEARRIVNLRTGARVAALAADVAGSEGLLTPWIVVEELPNWTTTPKARGMWTSIASAIPKWPGMRLVVIGHAGSPSHWSYAILEGARSSPAWHVTEIAGPLPWVSAEALEEQRRLLLPSEFERRHMNRWVASEDKLTTIEDVRACVGHSGPLPPVPDVTYAMSLDLGIRHDRTVLTTAHLERKDDRAVVVIDRLDVWTPMPGEPVSLADVEATVRLNHELYRRPPLVFDYHQAAQMMESLRAKGVHTIEFTQSVPNISRMATTLYNALSDHNLDLPDDDELIAELASVELRATSTPGRYRIDHSSSAHDDRAISVAMVVDHLLSRPMSGPVRVATAPGRIPLGANARRQGLKGAWSRGDVPGARLPTIAGPR